MHVGTVFHGDIMNGLIVELSGAYSVTLFEANIYIASDTSASVSMFEQRPNGQVVYLGAAKAASMQGPRAVAVAPDGHHAYVACGYSDAVTIFERDGTTGVLVAIGAVTQGQTNNALPVVRSFISNPPPLPSSSSLPPHRFYPL